MAGASCILLVRRTENGGDVKLEPRQHTGLVDVSRPKVTLPPAAAPAPQGQDLLLVGIDDPVFLHAEQEVFFGLLVVVSAVRLRIDDLSDDVGNPPRPNVLSGRWRFQINGDVGMSLGLQVGNGELASPAAATPQMLPG